MTPRTVSDPASLRQSLDAVRRQGKTIGFVPTMGALHRGHTSLMNLARAANDFVVVSVFVNPTQFGPNEDFTRYPRPLTQDLELCAAAGVDLVFLPTPEVMYPPGFCTHVDVSGLTDVLCGARRPGHFRGVTTVVLKLFNLVGADRAYFGQKDAQQVRVIRQMVRDLDVPVQIVVGPTVREADGLALSSRNQYLDAAQRREAPVLFHALQEMQASIAAGELDAAALRRRMIERIAVAPSAVLDYAEVLDAETLQPLDRLRGSVLLAVAVKFGATRLIDNLLVEA